jgi:hypothetical protein
MKAARRPYPSPRSSSLWPMRGMTRESVCEAVAQEIEHPAKVFVVSPALTGRLQSLASDIDGAVAAAEQRLKAVLGELRSAGFTARGSVGDEDPLLAIEDTLREFTPAKILIDTQAP